MNPIIIFALLISRPGVYDVDDWIEPNECSDEGGLVCDIDAAIKRMHDDCALTAELGKLSNSRTGCVFRFGVGSYQIKQPIKVCRQNVYVGMGGWSWGAETRIIAKETTAFQLLDPNKCVDQEIDGGGGGWTSIRDLAILHTGPTSTASPDFGVQAWQTFRIENVWISNFVQGIRVVADSAHLNGNANNHVIENVRIEWSEHAGVFARGGDANNGKWDGVDVSLACLKASRWNEIFRLPICDDGQGGWVDSIACMPEYRCSGWMDVSFLGNRIQNAHSASHTEPAGAPAGTGQRHGCGGIYQPSSSGGVTHSYCEGDTAFVYLGRSATGFGGTMRYVGPGGWIDGFAAPGGLRTDKLTAINELDPMNMVELRLGAAQGAPGTFFGAVSSAPGAAPQWPLRFKYLPLGIQAYQFDLANSNTYAPIRIGGTHAGTLGLGGLNIGAFGPLYPNNLWVHNQPWLP